MLRDNYPPHTHQQKDSHDSPTSQHDHTSNNPLKLGGLKLRHFGFTDEGRVGIGKYTKKLVMEIKNL